MNKRFLLFFFTLLIATFAFASVDSSLYLKKSISGKISPKSVVHNGAGIFYAQNMMYKHTVTVYNRKYELVKTIKDVVNPSKLNHPEYPFKVKGGPVECAFSHNGLYAWVSNYNMSGGDSTQFAHPGCDNCSGSGKYDSSFVYKINTTTHQIETIVKVGAVPKYVAVSPDDKWVLVSNWSSGDVSIVSVEKGKEVKRVKVGTFPRGIVVDSKSEYAYITVMGSTKIARLNLSDFSVNFIEDIGKGPRHLCISPDDKWLYLTLNSENKIAKIDLNSWGVQKIKVGHQPRSMTISGDGKFLYVVNYNDNTFSKIETKGMTTLAVTETKKHPIGITYDDLTREVWVACYVGYIQVFKDSLVKSGEKIELDEKIEEDQLVVEQTKPASVAILGGVEKVDSLADVLVEVEEVEVEEEVYASARFMQPIRRLYLESGKTFDFSKNKPKSIEKPAEKPVEKVEKVKTSTPPVIQEVKLESTSPYLVIVGSFKEADNAQSMIEIMKKKGLLADTFLHPTKQLNYVYVYSAASFEQAKSWATQYVGDKTEYWVMHQ